MKLRTLTSLAVVAVALPITLPSPRVASVAAPPVVAQDDDETPIGERMEVINKHMRALRIQLKDAAKNADSLKLVLEMQHKALEAKGFDPVKLSQQAGKDAQDKLRVEFRRTMHEFLGQMFELELALLTDDNDAAEAAYRALGKMKSPSHKQFKGTPDKGD